MPEKCKTLIDIMENIASPYLAESWDNIGLQIGDLNSSVHNVMISLDITEKVVQEAILKSVDLIITHHPLIFKPIKNIVASNPVGRVIQLMIKNNISLYCSHTNLDIANNGTNDLLARQIGLVDIRPFVKTEKEKYYKLIVFVPENSLEIVRTALCQAGAGHIGNYNCCTFNTKGVGTFMPLKGTNPYIGNIGELENVSEYRLETIVEHDSLNKVIKEMIEVHPYEEVAYDIIPVANSYNKVGLGRIANLHSPMTLKGFSEAIKSSLGINSIKIIGDLNKIVSKVSVCSGSGAEFIDDAYNQGCDCYITGDLKYHEAQYALQLGLAIIDPGHYETEQLICQSLADQINEYRNQNNYDFNVFASHVNINPFQIL